MEWDDLFLKINFQCKKCGREFDRMAITTNYHEDKFLDIIFRTECLSCGSQCTTREASFRLARRFEEVLDSLDSKVKDPFGTGIDPKCAYHWYDFCLKGSELYKELQIYPEFADLGSYRKLVFEGR